MIYYLVWLTSEMSDERARLLNMRYPGVLNAYWNGLDSIVMTGLGVEGLERIGAVHMKYEISKDRYDLEYLAAQRGRAPRRLH